VAHAKLIDSALPDFRSRDPPEALVYSARRRGDVVSEGIQAEGPWKSRDWLFHVFHGAESVH
jgi:hypothetical protein